MKKTSVQTSEPDASEDAVQQEIQRLFDAVEEHTQTLSELEEAEDFDENPDVEALREDKEVCLREIIRLEPDNIDAHTGLVEHFLEIDEVIEVDLEQLEQVNAAKPRRAVTALIKRARAALAEAEGSDDVEDDD